MPDIIDLTGQRFERLTVISFQGLVNHGSVWLCRCDCGTEKVLPSGRLRNGTVKSCGCLRREKTEAFLRSCITHGMSKHPMWTVWQGMIQRCVNPKHRSYYLYGGRGIIVCERWKNSFQAFFDDMGMRPTPKHEIDRIDSNGPYAPGNCKWSVDLEQVRNTRWNHLLTFNGKTQCMSAWADEIGLPYFTLVNRINKAGWSVERALTTPKKPLSDAAIAKNTARRTKSRQ